MKIKVSKYHDSLVKRSLDVCLSLFALSISSPITISIGIINKLAYNGPVFFLQKRTGKNGKVFEIVKFRTMVVNAEKLKKKYRKLNESDGPVFKIKNDPRFTPFGKILSNTGLDELPQFLNVLRGEMSIVGPRPLPVEENKKLSKKYNLRLLVKPGITSGWVVNGSHKLRFNQWMKLDKKYVLSANFLTDIQIILLTAIITLNSLFRLYKTIDLNKKSN